MERDEFGKTSDVGTSDDIDSQCAVNSLILDYYKKFGRKRDLEQYFSLSTAQSDIKDTSGLFWRKMKSENDSSDSGGRKSDSSHEVCRISIRCSLPDPTSSQDDDTKTKTESPQTESPPIIIEEVPADVSRHTDDDSINFDDNHSQKSFDALLDLSTHKPLSPTSSITSQRKLEWDSLADVGYANESDRKNSASSLSTLERLALKQQYSNNDSKQDIGLPTSQSTPLDENEVKSKTKKGLGKKTTKIYKKDIDFVEVNVPHTSDTNQAPSINVNLTKHISFNVEKDGGISVDNIKRDVNISPEKISVEAPVSAPQLGMDKEIQTSLPREPLLPKEKSNLDNPPKPVYSDQKIPVMISLNSLRKRLRRKRSRMVRRKTKTKKKSDTNKEITPQEKSGEQLSEAESFEYMPGHMYNQNKLQDNEPRPDNSTAGNKSSLESSGPPTTDSSKGSKHSLTKDLEKCIDVLKITLQQRYDDGSTKKKLIKDIVHRLVNSKYRDDDSTTEFLSGLSYGDKKLGLKRNNTSSSTSDANVTEDNKQNRPRKSILRTEKFNTNIVTSTSQSAPNLFTACENVNTNDKKTHTSNTESDASSRGKSSSENAFPRTSSEELYLKYLEALRREEAYKRHLKDKEMFLKQKLVSCETAFKVPIRQEAKISSRLKDLMNDLTRNNYDDGSGDASKLEGGSSSMDFNRFNPVTNQRSHSVFTLSSSHSECPKRPNLKKKMQAERELGEAGPSRDHYCCCPHHYTNCKVGFTDSSVQVNMKYDFEERRRESPGNPKAGAIIGDCKKCKPEKHTRVVPDSITGEIKYVCCCNGIPLSSSDVGDNIMIYKCSKLTNRGIQLEDPSRIYTTGVQCGSTCNSHRDEIELIQPPCKLNTATDSSSSDNVSNAKKYSKSSQTNMLMDLMGHQDFDKFYSSGSEAKYLCGKSTKILGPANAKNSKITITEATRCLQTEISINPKISDPNLSDISIVNDGDCAKLIAENVRQVSKQNSKFDNRKTGSDVSTNSVSGKLIVSSNYDLLKNDSDENTKDWQPAAPIPNNYILPIKGTNMSLKVNLGAVQGPAQKDQVHKGVTTEKIDLTEKATCIHEECTKSVQCFGPVDQNSNKKCSKESFNSPRIKYLTKKQLIETVPAYNTFPKNEVVKDKPPLKRFNTDTDTVSINTSVQTDPQMKSLNDNQEALKTETQPVAKSNSEKSLQAETPIFGVPQVEVKSRFGFDEAMTPKDYALPPKSIQYSDATNTVKQPNTYPKKESVKEKPPLKRFNTDNDKISVCTCVQTDPIMKVDALDSKREVPISEIRPKVKSVSDDSSQAEKPIVEKPQNAFASRFSVDAAVTPANIRMFPAETNKHADLTKTLETSAKVPEHIEEKKHVGIQKDLSDEELKSNKYQQSVKEKPPLKRLNTDNDKISVCTCVQTDPIMKVDALDSKREVPISEIRPKVKSVSDDSSQAEKPIVEKPQNAFVSRFSVDAAVTPANIRIFPAETNKHADLTKILETSSKVPEHIEEKKDVGIQKDLSDEELKSNKYQLSSKECPKKSQIADKTTEQYCKDTPDIAQLSKNTEQCIKDCPHIQMKNAWSETDLVPYTIKATGSCIACQTDIPEAKVTEVTKPPLHIKEKVHIESCSEVCASLVDPTKDIIVDLIQDITRRYSKHDVVKNKKKKCFSEIMTVLNYLLDTEDSTDPEPKPSSSTTTNNKSSPNKAKKHKLSGGDCCSEKHIDKSVQMSCGRTRSESKNCTESSELPCSSELQQTTTSSDSTACKVLRKIKKECEKFHQKRCKGGRKCEISSSTSVNCDKCKKAHHCSCRNHKCKRSKAFEKLQKKCIAYNLIIQTSESMLSEETVCDQKCRPLRNIVVKVPKSKDGGKTDAECKKRGAPFTPRYSSNRNCDPRETESTDEYARKVSQATVREYLEQNRPDFVEKTSQRQHCMKFIRERRTQDSITPRLKMVVLHQPGCMSTPADAPVFCRGLCYRRCETMVTPCIPFDCEVESCIPRGYDKVESCTSRGSDKVEPNIPCNTVEPCIPYSTCDPCNPCDTNFCNMCIDPCNLRSEYKRFGLCYRRCETMVKPCIPFDCEVESCIPRGYDKVESCIPRGSDKVEPNIPCNTVEPCIPYSTCDPCNPCETNFCNMCIDPCNMRSEYKRFANERAAHRDLLSLHVEQQPDLTLLSSDELRKLAQQIGLDLRWKKLAPKFISEREMKKHSERIYKTLPEVMQKKEEKKKENIKKTNLLMANIFKKNLQTQTLRGSVNLSNYNNVIKI